MHNLDLRALEAFRLVYRLRSFSAAAETMGSSQSNVSYVIGKLRQALGDPLFLKTARGVEPTEKAHAVFEFAETTLHALDELAHSGPFDPAQAAQTITVACNHYQRELLLPDLFQRVQADAPGLKLHILTAADLGAEQLRQGKADLLICPGLKKGDNLHSAALLDEHYACIAAPGSRWDGMSALDLDAYLSASHVTVRYGAGWTSGYRQALEDQGLRLNECHVVPSPSDLHMLLPGTDRISTLPARQARRMAPAYRALICPVPASFQIRLYWASRTHRSPVHIWLRDLIGSVAGALTADSFTG